MVFPNNRPQAGRRADVLNRAIGTTRDLVPGQERLNKDTFFDDEEISEAQRSTPAPFKRD